MEKYIVRANESFFFKSFESPYISALLGPRRVGKTTLLEYYMSLHPEKKWVYLNMDVLSYRERIAAEELEIMIEQIALQKIGGKHKLWVCIDEAQKCPQLFDQIKIMYDMHKGQDHIKFLLTGSAHLNLHKLSAESLAGRVELLHLREFNQRETTCLLYQDIFLPSDHVFDTIFDTLNIQKLKNSYSDLRPYELILRNSLEEYLIWGGLPEVIKTSSDADRLQYLGNYLQTYLEKDIRAIDSIGDLNLYRNLMKISAELTGSVRDDSKIMEALSCSRNTLIKYRDYLLATLQYTELYPYIHSLVKRLVKTPKGYLINNGLVSFLTGIHNLELLKKTGLIGHRLENWFLNEIQTWLDIQAEHHTIYFWRTSYGVEVDFVVTLGKRVVPFEVTYSPTIDSKKIENLKRFMASEQKANLGILCYLGPLHFDQENRILCLPAWMI